MPVQRGFIPGPMGGPYPGPQGGIQGFAPVGAQGFQQPVASQLVEGINNFVANYRDQREKDKAAALARATKALELLETKGLPIDAKEVAKDFKKAGVKLDYESQTPLEKAKQAFQEQQQAFQQQQQAAMGPMMAPQLGMNRAMEAGAPIPGMMPLQGPPRPGQMGMPPGAVMQGGPMPAPQFSGPPMPGMMPQMQTPPPAPPVRQPGILGRIGQALTGGPPQGPIPGDAGIYQALAQIARRGKAQMSVEDEAREVKSMGLEIMKKAIGGNEKAADMARSLGLFEALGPRQEVVDMYKKAHPELTPQEAEMRGAALVIEEAMGKPEMERQMRTIAADPKNLSRFGGSLEKSMQYTRDILTHGESDLEPEMGLDEKIEIRQRTADIMGQYPTMPYNIATYLAMAQPGTPQYAEAFSAVSKFFKPKGVVQEEQFAMGQKMDMARLQQGWTIHSQNLEMQKLQEIRMAAGQVFDDAHKMYEAGVKNGDRAMQETALTMLVEAANQRGAGLTTKRVRNWYEWLDRGADAWGVTLGGLVEPGELKVGTRAMPMEEGAGPVAAEAASKVLEAFKEWAARTNKQRGTEIRPDDFMSYMGIGKGF